MNVMDFIKPELLLLVPVLYALGAFIKKSQCKDWKIPFILTTVGIALALLYLFSVTDLGDSKSIANLIFSGITQGILAAGVAVLGNQLIKQATVGKEEDEWHTPAWDNEGDD